ncbi:MAG: glycosyltransferase involved in cell wall biosynthesis [Patiriisocius sp.]|jgi:glycosyltransferase involved in cell wall biosynthesis
MDISIVIPAYNEEESITPMLDWINEVVTKLGLSFEIIVIDDGSNDTTWDMLKKYCSEGSNLKAIKFKRNYGKSAALSAGFEKAVGSVVFTMDADMQDSPEEISEMRRMIVEDGYDLVSGWKKVRHDPITKTIPTKLYNWATRRMSGINLHDFNCGLKAYRNDVIKNVDLRGEMHRYIPVLASKAGYKKIGEKIVKHQKRKFGTTKFGLNRFINGPLDLLTVSFITRFGKSPMHIFGFFGVLLFLLGAVLFIYIGGNKLYNIYLNEFSRNITEVSSFYVALAAMIIGTQFFLAGFLGEIIVRSSSRKNYSIRESIG